MRNAFFFSAIVLGALCLLPPTASAQIEAGHLIKSPTNTAVYYVGEDARRHAFPNEKIYKTWYPDFSKVETVSEAELASFPLGKNVLYRPGSRLIKIPSVPEVYAVEPWGVLRNIPSEDAAIKLYGQDWAKKVDDIDVSFFFDYTVGGVAEVVGDMPVYPRGALVYQDGVQYLVDRRTDGINLLRPVTESGFVLNNFKQLNLEIFSGGVRPSFYQVGVPIEFPEQAFSCVWCNAEAYQKISVQNTQTQSGNGVTIESPADWSLLFENISGDTIVPRLALAAEQSADPVDAFADNLMVYRWDPADFDNDLSALADSTAQIEDYIYYEDKSPLIDGAIEVTALKNNYIYRNQFISKGGYFYQVQFTTTKDYAERYTDILDVMLDNLQLPS